MKKKIGKKGGEGGGGDGNTIILFEILIGSIFRNASSKHF